MVDSPTRLVLASSSPRRKALLSLTGLAFERVAPDVDESRLPGESPADYVVRLSRVKAREAAQKLTEDALVLGADTIVALGDEILGKPRDVDHARAMLASLRNGMHRVHSGITLLDSATGREVSDLSSLDVPMRDYSEAEVEAYIATGDPFDKAGAYAIQNDDFKPVTAFADCFASVMGLPLCHLLRSLRALGWAIDGSLAGTPLACQTYLAYECPVSEQVLTGVPLDTP